MYPTETALVFPSVMMASSALSGRGWSAANEGEALAFNESLLDKLSKSTTCQKTHLPAPLSGPTKFLS